MIRAYIKAMRAAWELAIALRAKRFVERTAHQRGTGWPYGSGRNPFNVRAEAALDRFDEAMWEIE